MSSKEEFLKSNGSFNNRHLGVHAEVFKISPFFDPRDFVQVKYEMLRAVERDGASVTDAVLEFGLSRKTYYQVSKAFDEGGMASLVPKKPGPKGPSKLHGEVAEYIDAYMSTRPSANAKEVAEQMEMQIGVRIHPRTIERYLEKKTVPPAKRQPDK